MGDTDNEHCDYIPCDTKNVKETHALGFLTCAGYFSSIKLSYADGHVESSHEPLR